MLCEVNGCRRAAKFGLYQLNPKDFTKSWINVCADHEAELSRESRVIREMYPDNEWTIIRNAKESLEGMLTR